MPGGGSALKNADWFTWTCVIGFPVQEIWRGTEDGTDVNAVDRSHGEIKDKDGNYRIIARADDFGKVSVYKYPIVVKDQQYNEFPGHSSHVTSCRFSTQDEYLYSTGGEDQCVFQWKVRANFLSVKPRDDDEEEDEEVEDEDAEEEEVDDDEEEEDDGEGEGI